MLDPFLGSGSVGVAAAVDGFQFLGVELEEESFEVAKCRVEYAIYHPHDFMGKKGSGDKVAKKEKREQKFRSKKEPKAKKGSQMSLL